VTASLTQYWVVWIDDGIVYAMYAWRYTGPGGAMAIVARRLAEGLTWVGQVHPSWLP